LLLGSRASAAGIARARGWRQKLPSCQSAMTVLRIVIAL